MKDWFMTEDDPQSGIDAGKPPYRRAIEIHLSEDGRCAVARLEDDHHHFVVRVSTEDGVVAEVRGEAIRRPWTLCALAVAELGKLEGMQVSEDPGAVLVQANIREQCTHMFDLAGLAIATLARGGPAFRRYDMTVMRIADELWQSSLIRDDGHSLEWHVNLRQIVGPHRFAGIGIRSSFSEDIRHRLPPEEWEAAMVLRRAQFVGKYRHRFNLDLRSTAGEGATNLGGCFVLQPERAMFARRVQGATISFPTDRSPPLGPDRRRPNGTGAA